MTGGTPILGTLIYRFRLFERQLMKLVVSPGAQWQTREKEAAHQQRQHEEE